jgi:hypothetical protein
VGVCVNMCICMLMYACMHVYMYVYVHVHACVHVYACIEMRIHILYVCVYMHMRVCGGVCMSARHACVNFCTRMRVCACACLRMHVRDAFVSGPQVSKLVYVVHVMHVCVCTCEHLCMYIFMYEKIPLFQICRCQNSSLVNIKKLESSFQLILVHWKNNTISIDFMHIHIVPCTIETNPTTQNQPWIFFM